MEKNKKIWVVAIILLAMAGGFWWWRTDTSNETLFDRVNAGGQPRNQEEAERYLQILDEKYKNDQYGSTTPEGTLELFVAALKQEDVALAAKYFLPTKQTSAVIFLRSSTM